MKQNQQVRVEEKTDTIHVEEEIETKNFPLGDSSEKEDIFSEGNTTQVNSKQSMNGVQKMFSKKEGPDLELSELLKKTPERTPRYTAVGSAAVEDRIKSDMLFIRNYICDHFDVGKIYALVLGGSYGAGDGGVKMENAVERPFPDYDFFVFFKKKSFIEYKNANVFFRSAGAILSKKIGVKVDFSCVYHKDYLSHLPLSLRWYDLQVGHKIVIGDLNAFFSSKTIDPWAFPIQEAFQLLLNRGVGVLRVKRSFKKKNYNALQATMLLYKTILAMGDSFLIAKGHYRSGLILRYEILRRHALNVPIVNELLPFYKKAVDFRLRPAKLDDHKKMQFLLSKVLYFFQKFYLSLFSLYYGKSLRDFAHLADTIIKEPIVDYRGHSTTKNILINVSSFGIGSIFSKWVSAYPANRLFAVLPFFLFDLETSKFLLSYIDKALMLNDGVHREGMDGKRYEQFISIWSRFN